jgi:hypothetical protein
VTTQSAKAADWRERLRRSLCDSTEHLKAVKRLLALVAALVSVTFVSLVVTSAGAAATVTTQVLTNTGTEPFYGGNCGFPLTATFAGEVRMTTIERNDGTVQLMFTPLKPSTITVTNPADGKSLTSLQATGEIIVITDSSYSDHNGGITWNFIVPGSGGVLQWIGMNNFVTGGFNGRFTTDTTAFCDYLADP